MADTDAMKSTTIPFRSQVAFVLLFTLAACSSASSDVAEEGTLKDLEEQAMPLGTVLDERITELLPAGSYNIEFEDNLGGGTVARGYVHLPVSGDPTDECAYEVDVEQTSVEPGTDTEIYTVFYSTIKPVGPDSFTKIVKIEEKSVKDDSYKEHYSVGVWGSGDDPMNPSAPMVLFPAFILVERGGMGYLWCGIARIAEVARLADATTGLIGWDQTQFAYTAAVIQDSWYKQIAELGGLGDKWYKPLEAMPVPAFTAVLDNSSARITKDNAGVVTITSVSPQGLRTFNITLTPTAERSITRPSGVKTFIERIAEVKGDQEAILKILEPEDDEPSS